MFSEQEIIEISKSTKVSKHILLKGFICTAQMNVDNPKITTATPDKAAKYLEELKEIQIKWQK